MRPRVVRSGHRIDHVVDVGVPDGVVRLRYDGVRGRGHEDGGRRAARVEYRRCDVPTSNI